jgi:hypothetical protein
MSTDVYQQLDLDFADECHSIAREKGFYDDAHMLTACVREGAQRLGYNPDQLTRKLEHALELASFMRMVTEIAEAAEAARQGNPPSMKARGFTEIEEELADVRIRINDWAAHKGYRVTDAMVKKVEHNRTRPYKHGKES